jgi:hypothetical protein
MSKPQKGEYYYHYKHNPNLGVDNYAYIIIGTGWDPQHDKEIIIYHPIYKTEYEFFSRTIENFCEVVNIPEYDWHDTRFFKIEDENIIKQLTK